MNKPNIAYPPRVDAAPQGELAALANVYKFVLDCHAKKKAAHPGGPNDAMKGSSNDRAAQNYT